MPMLLRYDDELVAERQKETFFLQLKSQSERFGDYDEATEETQLAWFKQWDIPVEMVAYRGLLAGNPGRYYVGFSSWDDPLLKLYCNTFEHPSGQSLHPDKYQMHVYEYEEYLADKAKGKFEPDEIWDP